MEVFNSLSIFLMKVLFDLNPSCFELSNESNRTESSLLVLLRSLHLTIDSIASEPIDPMKAIAEAKQHLDDLGNCIFENT